ncbi:hypothetical protein HXX76_005443 [Chlamydomonas incerta]|uniref:Uncharacterized protein n=1 Tax=Chlamydomonas incerta TaxID=51695 RepID=A0A835TCF9_CHLIN|nr:hypothetical protein HXX76_005443 [Chlamydomonas incerta]|eukprot:KAG2437824.1 hypothetical protein HXX76_005443 [Chlamydomonas incerta]
MQQSTALLQTAPSLAGVTWQRPHRGAHPGLLLVLLVALLGGDVYSPRLDGSSRLGVSAHAWGRADSPAVTDPHVADLGDCPFLRIAVINGVPYHYEVLAGLLHALRPYADRTDVFLNPYTRAANSDGAWEILRWSKARFVLLTRSAMASLAKKKPAYDLVILVSPDYELDANAALLRYIQRRLTIAFVHNSDFNQTQRLIKVAAGTAAELQSDSGRGSALVNRRSSVVRVGSSGALEHTAAGVVVPADVRLVTLSPHTAASLAEATNQPVEWMLAVYPFQPRTDCLQATEVDLLGRCLRGFSMQGKFSNLRRNYSSIWRQLQAHQTELTSGSAAPLFHISLLGKGQGDRLGIPPELEPHVTMLRRLHFRTFYEAIHHTFALIPALASSKYYSHKFSSTILSSLISGTPMIADRRFLAAYGMFNESEVYLQREGEQEVDVMLRVLRSPVEGLLDVRRALLELRQRLNVRARLFLKRELEGLCAGGVGWRDRLTAGKGTTVGGGAGGQGG